jgi:hypothetical protein
VDDLLSFNNPLLHRLAIHRSGNPTPPLLLYPYIRGIYPDCLNLETSMEGPTVPYLDLHIKQTQALLGHSPELFIHLYDKRRQPMFKNIKQRRYPHATSALSDTCKFGIITSRFHHLHRILGTDVANFKLEFARVLLYFFLQHYHPRPVLKRARALLSKHWEAFPDIPRFTLWNGVRHELAVLMRKYGSDLPQPTSPCKDIYESALWYLALGWARLAGGQACSGRPKGVYHSRKGKKGIGDTRMMRLGF